MEEIFEIIKKMIGFEFDNNFVLIDIFKID